MIKRDELKKKLDGIRARIADAKKARAERKAQIEKLTAEELPHE